MTCLSGLLINVFLSTLIYDFLCSITIQSWRNSYHVGIFYLGQPESAFLGRDLSYLALGSMIFYSLCSWNCTFEIINVITFYISNLNSLAPSSWVDTVRRWLVTSNAWHDFWRVEMWRCVSYPCPILLLAVGYVCHLPHWTLVSRVVGIQLEPPGAWLSVTPSLSYWSSVEWDPWFPV